MFLFLICVIRVYLRFNFCFSCIPYRHFAGSDQLSADECKCAYKKTRSNFSLELFVFGIRNKILTERSFVLCCL